MFQVPTVLSDQRKNQNARTPPVSVHTWTDRRLKTLTAPGLLEAISKV